MYNQIMRVIGEMKARNDDNLARSIKGIGPDYDYGAGSKQMDLRGHLGDAGKLPWHPTFSNESVYSNEKTPGGKWSDEGYRPSVQMVNDGRTRGLAEYMANVEPNSKLLTPITMRRDYFEKSIK